MVMIGAVYMLAYTAKLVGSIQLVVILILILMAGMLGPQPLSVMEVLVAYISLLQMYIQMMTIQTLAVLDSLYDV